MGFDDEWFQSRRVRFERAHDLEQLFQERGFRRLRFGSAKRAHNPTDAGHCLRKRVLQFLGAPESNPPSFGAKMVFAMGDKLGEVLAEVAMQARVYVDRESTLVIEEDCLQYPFSGRIDVPIEDPFYETHVGLVLDGDERLVPVEYKTIKASGFDDSEGTRKDGSKWYGLGAVSQPKKDHVMQLHHYLKAMRAPYGYLFYLNKNDQRTASHRVWWNPQVWQDCIDEALVVEQYVDAGLVPFRDDVGHRGNITFYQKRMTEKQRVQVGHDEAGDPIFDEVKVTVAEPGDINWNQGRFPCMWKGKDGGEAGSCSFLHLCWRDAILKHGSKKEKDRAKRFAGFAFKEGRLEIDLEHLRLSDPGEPDPAHEDAPGEGSQVGSAG